METLLIDFREHISRKWHLTGSSEEYFYPSLMGCYGNPSAQVVFVAEIGSLGDKQKGVLEVKDEPWMAWSLSKNDKLFRRVLRENDFIKGIPDGEYEQPWRWNCWITNFIKSSEYAEKWKKEWRNHDDILKASADLLRKEFGIIRPSMIVVMGDRTREIFDTYLPEFSRIRISVPHYSFYHKSPSNIARYEKIFKEVRKRFEIVSRKGFSHMKLKG